MLLIALFASNVAEGRSIGALPRVAERENQNQDREGDQSRQIA
jgi:hypothetical protein